jgi:hypothetical protein
VIALGQFIVKAIIHNRHPDGGGSRHQRTC